MLSPPEPIVFTPHTPRHRHLTSPHSHRNISHEIMDASSGGEGSENELFQHEHDYDETPFDLERSYSDSAHLDPRDEIAQGGEGSNTPVKKPRYGKKDHFNSRLRSEIASNKVSSATKANGGKSARTSQENSKTKAKKKKPKISVKKQTQAQIIQARFVTLVSAVVHTYSRCVCLCVCVCVRVSLSLCLCLISDCASCVFIAII